MKVHLTRKLMHGGVAEQFEFATDLSGESFGISTISRGNHSGRIALPGSFAVSYLYGFAALGPRDIMPGFSSDESSSLAGFHLDSARTLRR
jgi:hypothetical protein